MNNESKANLIEKVLSNLPFLLYALGAGLMSRFSHDVVAQERVLYFVVFTLLVNGWVAKRVGHKNYFTYGMAFSGAILLAVASWSEGGQTLVFEKFPLGIYGGLFLAAAVPLIFKRTPFTYYYSVKKAPPEIVETELFRKINEVVTLLWALLLLAAPSFMFINYSQSSLVQGLLSNVTPMVILLLGIPLSIYVPNWLKKQYMGDSSKTGNGAFKVKFLNNKEALSGMPLGFNKKYSEGVEFVLQFKLHGRETINGYLKVGDGECSYTEGLHESPDTTVESDSDVWLKITNKELSGAEALESEMYRLHGDMNNLIMLSKLFPSPNVKPKKKKSFFQKTPEFSYGAMEPGAIKKVVVIDGGPRTKSFSKSSFMAQHFSRGAQAAGAEVSYVDLKKLSFKDGCLGCFHCWSKEPGECVQKDDMSGLLPQIGAADLLVFVSPLYYFSVTAQMKMFLDRMLPNVLPFMTFDKGMISHPSRLDNPIGKSWVVISAGGFPQVENNFNGISAIFRNLHRHKSKENGGLLGELFLPAAELISQPYYRGRREIVEELCFQAGLESVKLGVVDQEVMDKLADPMIDDESFMNQANNFWSSIHGKGAYLKEVARLEYSA